MDKSQQFLGEHIVFIEASTTGSGEKSIEYARNTGRITTLVARNPGQYPISIRKHADHIISADTNDANAIINALDQSEWCKGIDAVLTTNDFFVVQAAAVAEKYGLPTTSAADVYKAKNKYLMREALQEIYPELNPDYMLVNDLESAHKFAKKTNYPFIAKPQDANDSLYVQLIKDDEDLSDYFEKREEWGHNLADQSFATGVLLEQVIDGEEYCLDVLQPWQNEMILMGAFQKKLAGQKTGNFVKIGAMFPAKDETTEALFDPISKVLKELGIKVGAVNVDCKVCDGQVKILEINPRLVGDQMGSHMIELSTGINPAHLIVEMALGNPISWSPKKAMGVAIHRITMPEPGYFPGILNKEKIIADPNVAYVNELGAVGTWYEPARSNQQVVGSVITTGSTPEDAMQSAEQWASKAQVLNYSNCPSGLARKYKKAIGMGYVELAQDILTKAVSDQKLVTSMPSAVSDAFTRACQRKLWGDAAAVIEQTKGNEYLQSEITAEQVSECCNGATDTGYKFAAERVRSGASLNSRFMNIFSGNQINLDQ